MPRAATAENNRLPIKYLSINIGWLDSFIELRLLMAPLTLAGWMGRRRPDPRGSSFDREQIGDEGRLIPAARGAFG